MKIKDQETNNNVLSAMELWQAFEYLSPQAPPAAQLSPMVCNWAIPINSQGDSDMPWVSKDKKSDLAKLFPVSGDKRRFLLYAGILTGHTYTNAARQLLGAAAIEDEERAGPNDAAALLLPINSDGFVAGLPFISSTPWALGGLKSKCASSLRFNFRGFFGKDGTEKHTIKALQELLIKRTLLPEQSNDEGLVTAIDLVASARSEEDADEIRKKYRTITAEDIRELTTLVFSVMNWAPEQESSWIIQTQRLSKKEMDDPLNSFYAEDIESVQSAVMAGNFDVALHQFLSNTEAAERVDLDANGNKEPLIKGVHPSRMPLAAWPGTYPLVTAQQFAVNTIHSDLAVSGIYSVNGPPGTGKTTMLKDIVASVVQQRADKLMAFNDPQDAFRNKLAIENHSYPAWQLDASLHGFGIVVTSANNGAVENISRELPGLSTIDKSIQLNYFSEVSDSLGLDKGKSRPAQPETWGLISAALGNSSNRNLFAQNFWWGDKDSKTLPNKSPNPLATLSIQEWIAEHGSSVPCWNKAKERYQLARDAAFSAVAQAADLANQLQRHSELLIEQKKLRARSETLQKTFEARYLELQQEKAALKDLLAAKEEKDAHLRLLQAQYDASEVLTTAQSELSRLKNDPRAKLSVSTLANNSENAGRAKLNAQENFDNHLRTEPGILKRLLFRKSARAWDKQRDEFVASIKQAQNTLSQAFIDKQEHDTWSSKTKQQASRTKIAQDDADRAASDVLTAGLDPSISLDAIQKVCKGSHQAVQKAKERGKELTVQLQTDEMELDANKARQAEVSTEIETLQSVLNPANLLDGSRKAWHLHELSRDDFHKVSPYQDDDVLFSARRDLFVASMELHKAFVVAAWPKLKSTLAAFTSHLQGQLSSHRIKGGAIPLWDAFFLTVPLISTSFASFPRLFRGIGCGALAWTLIDEAGQATPQQALGAIWRSKRAVIVGDPIQLEPVVSIPQELVGPLKDYCGTPDTYVPPDASVQTIADRSNRYGTLMGADEPKTAIWLGSPLVVHRRCLRPMFDIANAIAYEDKMVYGTGDDPNFPAPASEWLDAKNDDAQGHWIESQGKRAMELIGELTNNEIKANGKLSIYVITPFKVVSNQMREMLAKVFGDEDAKKMCGTVHTFQGKEADYVIFLLGGDPSRPGVISGFAGRKPNLANVAVTRAKKRLYVIGNRAFWCGSSDTKGYYQKMNQLLIPSAG